MRALVLLRLIFVYFVSSETSRIRMDAVPQKTAVERRILFLPIATVRVVHYVTSRQVTYIDRALRFIGTGPLLRSKYLRLVCLCQSAHWAQIPLDCCSVLSLDL